MTLWLEKTNSPIYNAFKLQFIPFKVYGLYPFNGWSKRAFNIYAMALYIIFVPPIPILALIYILKLVRSSDTANWIEISDSVIVIGEVGANIFKYLSIKLNPEALKRIMDWLNTPLFNSYNKKQGEIIEKAYHVCRKFFILFSICCFVTVTSWALQPFLFYSERKFSVELWFPFDPYDNSWIYYLVHLTIYIAGTKTAFCNAAFDTLITGLLYQASIQVQIIKDIVENLQSNAEEKLLDYDGVSDLGHNTKTTLTNMIIYKEISNCVIRYNMVKRFVFDVEDVFSFPLFSQFAVSVFLICFECLQLGMIEPFSYRSFYVMLTLITTTAEVFMYCYAGSLIYNETLSLNSDLYVSNWIDLELKSQKALLIIMEYGKRPFLFRAGKLVDLSLDTFATIMRRSYSLLAIMQNYN